MAKKKANLKLMTSSALAKKYKGAGLASEVIVSHNEEIWIPSKFLKLNDTTGGGLLYGKIMELFGEESAGKSLVAYDFSYCVQQLGGIVIWVDAEHAFSRGWGEANGLDLGKLVLFQNNAIETISDFIADQVMYWRSQLTDNEPILLVVDSIAALECLENINSSQTDAKAEMGNRAKAMDKMMRIRNELLSDLGVSSIWINQLRSKIGATKWEDPDTTPGGKAVKFYASIRLGAYGGKQIKAKIDGVEDRVGRLTSLRIKKNKIAPPKPTIKGAEVYFNTEYDKEIGFNKYFGLAELLVKKKVITRKKGASRFYYKDNMLANGEDALMKVLLKDDKLRKRLIRKSGVNTINKTQKRINSIGRNLYPIQGITFETQTDE